MAQQEKPAFDGRTCCRVFWLNPRLHNALAILVFFAAILGWNYAPPMACWNHRSLSVLVLVFAGIADAALLLWLACNVFEEPDLLFFACVHVVCAQATGTLTSSWWCSASDGPNIVTALGGTLLVLGVYAVLGIVGATLYFVASSVRHACRAAIAAGRTPAGAQPAPT